MPCKACGENSGKNPCHNCQHRIDKEVGDLACDCKHCVVKRKIGPKQMSVGDDVATFSHDGQNGSHLCTG